MLTSRVIACLDVARGKVIRGVHFSADREVGDPVTLAAEYNRQGADELVFYDITASAEHRGLFVDLLEKCAEQLFIPLTVGGGVKSPDDVKRLLRAGADKVSLNTYAVADPELVRESARRFGSQCIVLSMDVRWTGTNYEVVTHGGRNPTGKDALAWAQHGVELGAGEIVVNSIDADGTKAGYELTLTKLIATAVPIPVVASGGAGKLDDFYDVLVTAKADAALAAGVFHYGETNVAAVKQHLHQRGVAVRLDGSRDD